MSKYIVETFYTCSFKIVHRLDEINEKNLSEIENRKDGKFEIIDVKLNNRKTKAINEQKLVASSDKKTTQITTDISSIVNEKVVNSDKLEIDKSKLTSSPGFIMPSSSESNNNVANSGINVKLIISN